MTTTLSPLEPIEQVAADALRALGHGDRKIANALGRTHWSIRTDRALRVERYDDGDEPYAVVVGEHMVAFYV